MPEDVKAHITGVVSDAPGTGVVGTLTKGGLGTLALSGANTYDGATNATAGGSTHSLRATSSGVVSS